jgi:peptidoglycan/LPS O-acetylase OafA/YrhL
MTRAERTESVLLAVILTIVAVAAGWASFTHVHDWTMRHAPSGTPDAFGWVNAVISELVPVAAFLTIRRRRRTGQPIGYPLGLLIAAATLSLAAQLAVAQPSPSGWLLSAVPALAFMALVKLVFTGTPADTGRPAPANPSTPDTGPADDTPAPEPVPAAPPRSTAVVPVPAAAFTRLNRAAVTPEATR